MAKGIHKKSSDLIRDIIIGVSDGLTVPFALTAGMSGIMDTNHLIIASGIAEIAAGSISMGLGGFLAGESEVHHYNWLSQNEYYEIETMPESEVKEVEDAFLALGVDAELTALVAHQITRDKDRWVEFMMRFEIGLEKPEKDRARKSGMNIAVSYLMGGLIPLFPYLLTPDNNSGLIWSSIVTILALMVFGFFKSRVTGQPLLKGTLKVTGIGIIAAGASYLLAKLVA
jgi:vacuolar iron transporter family protein